MADVFDLQSRRAAASVRRAESAGTPPMRCPVCGGEWFRLKGGKTAPPGCGNGAVTLREAGGITGYYGTPVCVECDPGEVQEHGEIAGALPNMQEHEQIAGASPICRSVHLPTEVQAE